jgi:hypothetical protein
MLDLTSHLLLTSDGWEFLSNLSSYDEADSLKQQLELQPGGYEYVLGQPKGGPKYSVEVLTSMGMVGLYRRGGRTVVSAVLDTPSLPVFSDNPSVVDHSKQGRPGGAYDRPLQPACAA